MPTSGRGVSRSSPSHSRCSTRETIPDTSDQVAQYLLVLEGEELTKYVDFKASAANVLVRHNLSGSGDLSALLKNVDRFIAQTFSANVIVRPTGESILYNDAS